jgi:2-desacetyl-2-hydroxyethyl bacteriochlorophyllide A dehydrogenase
MSNETMRAITILGPRQIRCGETEIPAYGEDEVLVRVHCVGICATDLEIYDGSLLYFQDGRAAYPIIPGHEWSGEIVAVGSRVRGFAVGDRVVGETTLACGRCPTCLNGRYNLCPNRKENGILGKHGATAEYMSFPAFALHKIPDNIPYDQACLIEPAAVAFRGASRIRIGPEDSVAVFGAGPIGLLSVQMAKAFGAKQVTLIDYNRPRLELGRSMGADGIVDLNDVSLTDAAKTYTNGEGYTKIIEASGNPQAMADTTRLAAEGARICMIGLCGGRHAHMDIDKVVTSDLEIFGSVSSPGVWQHVVPLFAAGKVNVLPLMTHRFPLERYEEALQLIERKDPGVLKILIQIV